MGEWDGRVIRISKNGCLTWGYFSEGDFNGSGFFINVEGDFFTGDMKNSLMEGRGVYEWFAD